MKPAILYLAALLALPAAVPKAGDWPAWRGPAASGSTAAGEYPTRWSLEDAAWKLALPGSGVSTPRKAGKYIAAPVSKPQCTPFSSSRAM